MTATTAFLLYGATGYVGEAMARECVKRGMAPILAGRNAEALAALGRELGLAYRVCALDDAGALDAALAGVSVVLHCAGPFLYTSRPMVDACLRTGVHYLDITGEFPVFEAAAARDAEAQARGVMLMPAVGFDVVPTDCLAVYLKKRLPTATHLTMAFHSVGPSGLPPGTQRTVIELLRFGNRVRVNGQFARATSPMKMRAVDFGAGPVEVTQLTWGDVFTAYYSTGIPNIEEYTVLPRAARQSMAVMQWLRPLLALGWVRTLLRRGVKPGPSPSRRAQTVTHVWGEVTDGTGGHASARLHGPEAGVEWTVACALAVVERVMRGEVQAGYQTPAKVYGAELVMTCAGVTREDVASA
ncbi:saccharopine dehydrogenase family protein [Gemmatimonas groenlandica]|uniref:NAD(P)H-binding protein n=1 Tax=Gemmatimonas groenlandica TaxID=2732249 RepID=A0A6M4ITY1_9BACT|nr:saccharopine dehydrogenase NADP-binding domain-containing protein [Gemmatimonas groenlandica]QJR37655.1 NAD(P)H-binding protein [Gemmatimonas groenlandica]